MNILPYLLQLFLQKFVTIYIHCVPVLPSSTLFSPSLHKDSHSSVFLNTPMHLKNILNTYPVLSMGLHIVLHVLKHINGIIVYKSFCNLLFHSTLHFIYHVEFHCMNIPSFIYPFPYWWTFRLLPFVYSHKQCYYEGLHTSSWVHLRV